LVEKENGPLPYRRIIGFANDRIFARERLVMAQLSVRALRIATVSNFAWTDGCTMTNPEFENRKPKAF
jgi:hypothetical protein